MTWKIKRNTTDTGGHGEQNNHMRAYKPKFAYIYQIKT